MIRLLHLLAFTTLVAVAGCHAQTEPAAFELTNQHPDEEMLATFKDDGNAGWFYYEGMRVMAYSRVTPIESWRDDDASYATDPPTMMQWASNDKTVRTDVIKADLSIEFSEESGAALLIKGEVWCFITLEHDMGFSKGVATRERWGEPWDETFYREFFPKE